jgi:hypothetical protein
MTSLDIKQVLAVRHRDDFFMCEVKGGSTWFDSNMQIMDAVAIKKSWRHPSITAYEIKVSKADFKSDDKWPSYMKYCSCFSFVCPRGLITRQEIETIAAHNPGVGLIYVSDKLVCRTIIKPLNRHVPFNHDFLMYVIMNRLDSDRLPFHSTKRDWFEDWLKNKRRNAALGINVNGAIRETIQLQEQKIQILESEIANKDNTIEAEIAKALDKSFYWDVRGLVKMISEFEKPEDLTRLIEACKIIGKVLPINKAPDAP